MFESVVTEYLDKTKGKYWSILGILEFARSNTNPKLSVATIDDFKDDLFAVLRSYTKKCNIHVYTRNRATKILSQFNSLFSTAEVKQFIKDLEYHEEARLNVTSTYTATDQQENQKLIDQLRETGNNDKREREKVAKLLESGRSFAQTSTGQSEITGDKADNQKDENYVYEDVETSQANSEEPLNCNLLAESSGNDIIFRTSLQQEGKQFVPQTEGFKVAKRGLQDAEFTSMRTVTRARSGKSQTFEDNGDILTDGIGDDNSYLQKAVESMVGKVESSALIVDDVDLEEVFEKYYDACENKFDDIMDLRPTSQLTKTIPEVTWEKFILNTYPDHQISDKWEESIRNFFMPKDTLVEWEKTWRGLFDEKESNDDLVIKDALYNILSPYIKAFKAPFNILKSNDLEEKQYSSQFVIPILKNTLEAVCDVDWRDLEVPIGSSKYRRNSNINPFIDKVLSAKRADGVARFWRTQEEILIYEQTGPPDVDDITDFYIHDYKLIRTMRDVLNQRIILRLHNGIKDYNNLASFGALGHRDEVFLFWCTIHPKSYCLREYGSFRIPATWQDLPVLSEAIILCLKYFVSTT
ncbi:4371_t:CDS:2 [Paraglomus occultum]|uniref:4371_t:CDS:1 n=1 Tax=Paraglomus occultum TaxID=144539 RepID=A0A9N9CBH8_9GLOM|nr:4371_t:CDS:2 [Paraglomus occultum]